MSWSYNPTNIKRAPPPPTLDYWRYKVGDVIEDDPILSNEEINAIALLNDNEETLVIYELLESAINVYSSKTGQMWTTRKLGPQSESRQADTRLKALYKKLEDVKSEMAARWIIVKRRERGGGSHGVCKY